MGQVTQLKPLIDVLLDEIRKHGIKEVSMEQYQTVCNGILKQTAGKGVEVYSYELMQNFLKTVEIRCTNEEICPEYFRFQKRVVKMLNSLADTGKVDFSAATVQSKYEVSDENATLITSILNENALIGEVRFEMDIVLRHIITYFSNQSKSVANISDDDLLRFVTEEMPKTNPGSIGRTLRGMKYFSSYLKIHIKNNIVLDFTQLKVKTSSVKAILPYTQPEIGAMIEKL